MPRVIGGRGLPATVPQITAGEGTAIAKLPTSGIPVQDFSTLEQAGRRITNLGDSMVGIGEQFKVLQDKVQAQSDTMESTVLANRYDAQLRDIHQQLDQDPTLTSADAYKKAFLDKEKDARDQTLGLASNDRVKNGINYHVANHLPGYMVDIGAAGIKKQIGNDLANFETIKNDQIAKAAESATPEGMDRARTEFEAAASILRQKGSLSPQHYQKALDDFYTNTYDKKADLAIQDDPTKFRQSVLDGDYNQIKDAQGNIVWPGMDKVALGVKMTRANEVEHKHEVAIAQAHKAVSDLIKNELVSQASRGQLDVEKVQNALDNKDPYVTPQEARDLLEKNTKPVDPAGEMAVRAMRLEYSRQPPTLANIAKYRDMANKLDTNSPELGVFLRELNNNEIQVKNMDTREVGKVEKQTKDQLHDLTPPQLKMPGMGFINAIEKNMSELEKQQVLTRIHEAEREGLPADQIDKIRQEEIKKILDARAARLNAIPDTQKRRNKIYEGR